LAITMTSCFAVIDGKTFLTEIGSIISLANVTVPEANKPGFEKPKEALE